MAKPITLPSRKSGFRLAHPAVLEMNDFAAIELGERRLYKTAIIAAKRAIKVTPNSRELWSNLGTFFFNTRQFDQAEACYMRAISIDPDYAIPYCNLALVYGATRHFDLAMEYYSLAEQRDANYMAVQWNRSLLLLRHGYYERGFKEYEIRIPYKKHKERAVYPKMPAPLYNGEPLLGKSIYVVGEQGIGDTIMFSRFLPWLHEQGCKIYLCVSLHVCGLLWNFRDMVEFIPEGVPVPKTDYSMVMGSLPHWAGATMENLRPDPGLILERVESYAENSPFPLPQPQGPDPFRVGIVWRGNPEQDRDEERSVPFNLMARVAENPRVWVHSFQVGPASSEIGQAGADKLIFDLSPSLQQRGLVGCGAALLKMDLLITSCTMIAHLAGVLGIPCWVMLCYDAYWPWLVDRDDSPWYPNTRLFRQPTPDDWATTMINVLQELETKLSYAKE